MSHIHASIFTNIRALQDANILSKSYIGSGSYHQKNNQ
jgi:hypothetical protein